MCSVEAMSHLHPGQRTPPERKPFGIVIAEWLGNDVWKDARCECHTSLHMGPPLGWASAHALHHRSSACAWQAGRMMLYASRSGVAAIAKAFHGGRRQTGLAGSHLWWRTDRWFVGAKPHHCINVLVGARPRKDDADGPRAADDSTGTRRRRTRAAGGTTTCTVTDLPEYSALRGAELDAAQEGDQGLASGDTSTTHSPAAGRRKACEMI
jgi:hypothetical protein